MNEPRFDEKNVLIIGSSSIIGVEISTLFRKASMRVITTYSSTKPKDFDG